MEYLVPMALAILLEAIKNPAKVKKLKAALRKLRDALVLLDLDDK